jgi:hypothetical protein
MQEFKMDNNKLFIILTFITPGIIHLIMKQKKLNYIVASNLLYSSLLYETLENAETGLYRLSPKVLFNLLNMELKTGKIIFPREQ